MTFTKCSFSESFFESFTAFSFVSFLLAISSESKRATSESQTFKVCRISNERTDLVTPQLSASPHRTIFLLEKISRSPDKRPCYQADSISNRVNFYRQRSARFNVCLQTGAIALIGLF